MTDTIATVTTRLVRGEQGRIVDPAGRTALRRGIGIGNWLLPEGYMWGFGDPVTSPRAIEAYVAELVGEERAAEFWTGFRRAFFSEADVAAIAAEGFDHIRLPINSRVVMTDAGEFIESGFAIIEECVRWCERHGLLVVLDLHGAPGGQTGTNIDDSPAGRPDLFMADGYADLTEHLWLELSRRYRDDDTVAAYDLLNEPLPGDYQHRFADALAAIYRRLTAAIRATGDQHLIMYEGSNWANNWAIFTAVWDENTALQFHKYWSPPDRASIADYLRARDELGLPIYMGESGENSVEWMQTAFQLFEDESIGWNLWPWKKIDTPTSPRSVPAPDGWADIVAGTTDAAARPDAESAWRILTDLLGAMRLQNCDRRGDVVSAVFRTAPLSIPATGYVFRDLPAARRTEDATASRLLDEVTGDRSARSAGDVPDVANGVTTEGTTEGTDGSSDDVTNEGWMRSRNEGFRAGDGPRIVRTRPDSPLNPFAPAEEERAAAGTFEVQLDSGDEVSYDVGLREARAVVVRASGPAIEGLEYVWDDGAPFVQDAARVGAETASHPLSSGRHLLTLRAGDVPVRLTAIRVDVAD
ncbi:glycoside hydrolase family 5 protein [Rathayibacter sp. CAU 1779]